MDVSPTTEPINPVPQFEVTPQPVQIIPTQNIQPLNSPSEFHTKLRSYSLIISVIGVFIIIFIAVIYLISPKKLAETTVASLPSPTPLITTPITNTPTIQITNFLSPTPTSTPTECNSPLAPLNVRPYVRCYYRQIKIDQLEAQAVENRISQTVGSLTIPISLVFEHSEVYKGIPIKWTKNQPLTPDVLTWLKAGIDILPNYFNIDHPVAAIISATDEELESKSIIKPGPDTMAYASGLNIFITATTAKGGSTYYPVDKTSIINILFHEWVHVVQYYEALETFTEEYLAKGRLVEAMATGPLEKGFAKEVGWVYNSDEFGDGIIAKLKADSESQKTTDYGKTKVREDMAESGALFMVCKSNLISEARILWWEKTTGESRTKFCH